jgi:hypothetical protein
MNDQPIINLQNIEEPIWLGHHSPSEYITIPDNFSELPEVVERMSELAERLELPEDWKGFCIATEDGRSWNILSLINAALDHIDRKTL